jgi:hypothetical protein
MKTRFNQIAFATIFSLVFIAGTVSAKGNEAKASGHALETENTLEVENWMMDETIWAAGSTAVFSATEEELEVENWMTNQNTWKVATPLVETEKEEALEVEPWMVNSKIWKG